MEPDEMPRRQMNKAEELVGLDFNPSGNVTVDRIKQGYADQISLLHTEARQPSVSSTKASLIKIAIQRAMDAQMWAVKAMTYKY